MNLKIIVTIRNYMHQKEFHEIITTVNFFKGVVSGFDIHKKEDFIIKFLENNKELIPFFENASVLSFGLKNNIHTKQLTKIFLDNNYNVNEDKYSSFVACEKNHLKSTKIIIENGFNLNNELNGKIIIEELLSKIDMKTSNSSLRKINKILSSIELDIISYDKFLSIHYNMIKAKTNLLKLNVFASSLMTPIINDFSQFEYNFKVVKNKKDLDAQLNYENILIEKKSGKSIRPNKI